MRDDADDLIRELSAASWFGTTGQPVPGESPPVRLPSWVAALEYCDDRGWIRIVRTAAGRLADALDTEAICGLDVWNRVIAEYVGLMYPLIDEKLSPVALPAEDVRRIRTASRWVLPHACMEARFVGPDLAMRAGLDPRFFRRAAEWYVRGRFPCGWVGGVPPAGKLVVY